MIVCAVSFSDRGRKTGEKLSSRLKFKSDADTPLINATSLPGIESSHFIKYDFHFKWRESGQSLHDFTAEAFRFHLPLLFIGAVGIAVRAVSPFVKDKTIDSPVMVMDDAGHFIIPILSGHLGGANDLAALFAGLMGAVPVITTASDVNHCFAADVFARRNGLAVRNREGIRLVADNALSGEPIRIFIDPEIRITAEKKLKKGNSPEKAMVTLVCHEPADVTVSMDKPDADGCLLWLSPKETVIGMGCRRGKTFEELNNFLLEQVRKLIYCPEKLSGSPTLNKKDPASEKASAEDVEEWIRLHVRAIATLDRKADEEGLQILAQYWHIPLLTYSSEELNDLQGDFSKSDFVREVTGVSNVCERAAVKACEGVEKEVTGVPIAKKTEMVTRKAGPNLILRKQIGDGMTLAAAEGKAEIRTFDTAPLFSNDFERLKMSGEAAG